MDEIKIKALIDAGDSAKTIGELKKALRDLKSAAIQVDEGTDAFNQITQAAGELQDKIGDLNARTKNLGDDLKNLSGFISVGQGIAGAFSAMQGAAALFGGENQQVEESLLKVQSAMAILQGIEAVGNVLQKESAAALLVQNGLRKVAITLTSEQAVVTAAEAVAAGTATVAQRALNAAMTANPVLALVGVLATAVGALMAFTGGSNKASEAQKQLNEEILKNKAATELETKTFEAAAKAILKMKTGSEERAIALSKLNKEYGTSLQNYQDEEKFIRQINSAVEDYISGAKRRLLTKINESKVEALLLEAQKQREEGGRVQSIKEEIQKIKRKNYFNEEFRKADLAHWEQQLKDEQDKNDRIARGYEAQANKLLATNANMLAKETAQEKAEREKKEKEKADADKKAAQEAAKRSQDASKNQQKIEEDKFNKMKAYAEAHAKSLESINYYITDLEDSAAQESLKAWKDSYAARLAENSVNLEIQISAEKAKYQELYNSIKTEFEASPVYVEFESKVDRTDPIKFAKAYQEAFDKYVKFNPQYGTELSSQLALAQAQLQTNIKQLTQTTAAENAKVWKEQMEVLKELMNESTKIALATDEYKRFYDFLQLRNKQLLGSLEEVAAARQQENKSEAQSIQEKIDLFKKEIKERTDLNEAAGEYATIENMRRKLAETTDGVEREGIQNAINITIEKNKEDEKQIGLLQDKLDLLKENNDLIEKSKKPVEGDVTFEKELEKFIELLTTSVPDATEKIDDFQTALYKLTQMKEIGDIGGVNPDNIEFMKTYAEFNKNTFEYIFNLNRDANKKQIGDSLNANIQLAAIYQDKLNMIKSTEDEINEVSEDGSIKLQKIYKDTEDAYKATITSQMPTGDENLKYLLDNLKTASGELKQFSVDVTDTTKQFGIDFLGKLIGGQDELTKLNKNLNDRYDLIVKSEEKTYNDALFTQFKALEEGNITEKEYAENTENIQKNHQENLLINQVIYGKKSQADLLKFYQDRELTEKQKEEEEKQRKIKNAETLLNIERTLRQGLLDLYNQDLDKRSAMIDKNLEQELAAIDAKQQAFEMASSEMTAQEKADKMALDQFDLERKDAEDKAKAEQQALEKKRFDADKANKMIQVGIEYALAIAKAWGTLGPFGAPMAVFLGAQAIIAEAAIAATEYTPAFAEGGMVMGPGGPKDDKINAKLSNGESVINAKSTKMYAPLLSAINVAGGGKAFPMATGGMVTPPMVQAANENYDMSRLEYILEKYASRPIETYVKEVDITNAQRDTSKINKRTKF